MTEQIDTVEAEQNFRDHVARHASEARLRYGLYIDHEAIVKMLGDPDVVRYPTTLDFDASRLEPGEFAHPERLGGTDEFRLFVHPWFEAQPDAWPLLIAYHIPTINYGQIVSHEHAEIYGSTLLGLDIETYYQALCELADSIPG